MKFLPERYSPGFCLPDNSPWIIPHPHRTINPRTTALNQVPFWATVTKCFELNRFYSELYLSEGSIAIGDPSTERIVNPLLELRSFSTFFSLMLCYWVTKLKWNISKLRLELISNSTTNNVNIQWWSGNLINMFKMPMDGVFWSQLNNVLQVPRCRECSSTLSVRVAQVPKYFECSSLLSVFSARAPRALECPERLVFSSASSARMSDCLQRAYRVPTEYPNGTKFWIFICPNR